ncbi:hypothetical protein KW799_02145 [Candidatus Parcubacteria bacterium]|nr:hypothetical protein [Candidatus Parcubacteria bacterium]
MNPQESHIKRYAATIVILGLLVGAYLLFREGGPLGRNPGEPTKEEKTAVDTLTATSSSKSLLKPAQEAAELKSLSVPTKPKESPSAAQEKSILDSLQK